MRKPRILWIEDEQDIVDLITPLLTAEGWDVKSAISAAKGRELALEFHPDLIVSDVMMPGEHGFNGVENLKDDPRLASIPVIIFSNVTHKWEETTATREDAMLADTVDFVDKGDGPKALILSIRQHLPPIA